MGRGPLRRWCEWATSVALLAGCGAVESGRAAVVRVPENFPKIQNAINAAQSGDTVMLSRGTHAGGLTITGISVVLASRYIETGDTNDIALTTISGGSPILTIHSSAGAATTVRGLTFLNGGYHIVNGARRASILDSRFIGGSGDQVSFESAGGVVRGCRFLDASDDGIDIDGASDPIVENNTILDSGDDGIEMRLHNYTGQTLQVVIRGNLISGCQEDGIQLIDYSGASNRDVLIEGNVLTNNAMVGLASMADGNTIENFAGAPMVEPIRVIANTICGHPIGVTGGDNMLLMNNIIAHNTQFGVKRVGASSLVSYNNFWGNATDWTTSNVDLPVTLQADPRLLADFELQDGSPCIDAGAPSMLWNGKKVSAPAYLGMAPDLGAREAAGGSTVSAPGPTHGAGMTIDEVRPNPSSNSVTIAFTLPYRSPARIEVVDLAGRRVLERDLRSMDRGQHVVNLHEAHALVPGVYQVRLLQAGRWVARPWVVTR